MARAALRSYVRGHARKLATSAEESTQVGAYRLSLDSAGVSEIGPASQHRHAWQAVLGVKEVVAYPFGHHNDTAKEGLRLAGFEMARTIEQGYVRIGTDKLALPTIRINYGMGLDALVGLIG